MSKKSNDFLQSKGKEPWIINPPDILGSRTLNQTTSPEGFKAWLVFPKENIEDRWVLLSFPLDDPYSSRENQIKWLNKVMNSYQKREHKLTNGRIVTGKTTKLPWGERTKIRADKIEMIKWIKNVHKKLKAKGFRAKEIFMKIEAELPKQVFGQIKNKHLSRETIMRYCYLKKHE